MRSGSRTFRGEMPATVFYSACMVIAWALGGHWVLLLGPFVAVAGAWYWTREPRPTLRSSLRALKSAWK